MSNSILTISNYRAELMGIATIMILIGHSIFYGQGFIDYGYLQDIFTLGYSGVDIFLFLSGYGLVYSMQKNEVKDFYKHRLIRIVPSVLAIMAINVIVNCKNLSLHFLNPMYWFGSYWYIGFILTAYFVFPVLYKYIYRKGAIAYYCSVLISLLLFLPFLFTGNAGSNAYTCYVTRIPIFVMGACFAMGAFAHLFSTKVITLMGVFGILGLIPFYMSDNLGGNVGMNTYYVFTILTPPHHRNSCMDFELRSYPYMLAHTEMDWKVQFGNLFDSSYYYATDIDSLKPLAIQYV